MAANLAKGLRPGVDSWVDDDLASVAPWDFARFAVGEPELAAQVPGRHVHAAGQHLDIQRLRVLPVDVSVSAGCPVLFSLAISGCVKPIRLALLVFTVTPHQTSLTALIAWLNGSEPHTTCGNVTSEMSQADRSPGQQPREAVGPSRLCRAGASRDCRSLDPCPHRHQVLAGLGAVTMISGRG